MAQFFIKKRLVENHQPRSTFIVLEKHFQSWVVNLITVVLYFMHVANSCFFHLKSIFSDLYRMPFNITDRPCEDQLRSEGN